MKRWWLVWLAFAAGCGGGAGVESPTPIPPSLVRITVTGTDLLLVGTSTFEQVYSSGTTSLSGTWRVFSKLRMYGGN
jgi:hypothetical protein